MTNLNDNPRGGTFALSKAGVKIGNSDAKDIDIAAPNGAGVDYCIDGIMYHAADAADIAIDPSNEAGVTISTQAADTTCLYLFQLDADGALTTVKGVEVATADLTAKTKPLRYPTKDDDVAPIGFVKIVTVAVTFLAGTDNFSKSGVTDTFVDLFAIPPHPNA